MNRTTPALADQPFVAAFEDLSLPASAFRHADHVRLARLYLLRQPLPAAMTLFADGLKRFAANLGKPEKYHETIPYAFIILVNERLERTGRDTSWAGFRAANADLFDYPSPIIDRLYRPETLGSDFARRVFVLPDASAVSDGFSLA